jgi:signal transduction histidine kinase
MPDNIGLTATINWLCSGFQELHKGIQLNTQLDIPEPHIPEPLKIVIFRIIQEALNNIAKHSRAERVVISMEEITDDPNQRRLQLFIQDNGRGFDMKGMKAKPSSAAGLGLDTMKERAELSGGSFLLTAKQGIGTTIQAA